MNLIRKQCSNCLHSNAKGEKQLMTKSCFLCNYFSNWMPFCREEELKITPLNIQVGGSHYKDFAIQPAEFIHKNGIGFLPGNVIKYVCRYKAKNGAEDLKKAIHYCELLLQLEYGQNKDK